MSSREPGHCELFAGALVLLARSEGIPARVVTGFKGGTWNAYSGNYTIRNSDAHAWAEVWDPQKGAWLREDPLAAAAADDTAGRGAAALAGLMDRSWSARLTSLRVFWYRRIVNFDQQTQVDTLSAIKAATDSSGKWLRISITELGAPDQGLVLRALGCARGSRASPRPLPRSTALAWLLKVGALAPRGDGPRQEGRPGEAGGGPLARRAWTGRPPFVADLQRLRYGPAPTWPRPSEVFRRARKAGPSSRRRASASSQSTS